jgi:enoyl-CoA hydratase
MNDRRAGRDPKRPLTVEADGAVRIVTLNRPQALNAADEGLHGELASIWPELDADPETRAIVLTGAGGAFSGGGDLHLLQRMTHDTEVRAAIMAEAAVNGPAVGLGCSLASMSDIVLVEEQAYFADPHVALGLVAADGGAVMWPLLTSLLRAKEYILLGDRLSAADAVQIGVANRVVPTGTSVDAAVALGQRVAALPSQSVRETKALLNQAVRNAVDSLLPGALATESASFDEPAFRANLEKMLQRKSG